MRATERGASALANPGFPPGATSGMRKRGGVMAKRFGRPSQQYSYEHYD